VGENELGTSLDPDFSGRSNRGPVAQLGARFHGMEEVVGSIPTRSTKFPRQQPISELLSKKVRQKSVRFWRTVVNYPWGR
jgi:hypothetical protein